MKIKSASHPTTNNVIFGHLKPHVKEGARLLDFGAGYGHMSQRIGTFAKDLKLDPKEVIFPCEIVPEEFEYTDVTCTEIKPDSIIPFPDAHFDVVYAIEVMEHTQRPYDLFQEAARVLKPGGTLIVSTPNVSHLVSRISNLFSGFPHLYPPPSKKVENAGRICGHIMPLTYPYFHYGAATAGFTEISFHTDRLKKGAIFLAIILWPFLKLSTFRYLRRLKQYDAGLADENSHLVPTMNSLGVLASRSSIVIAKK
ncbi:class I SAM-dependent methyltransferase [Akkermansiaceae bacterium]|nr:class I SAM-dependent methyltransferase [Akkermansiaceae bacterium]MDA9831024.1 class I SAM-dependent methyltransferase [Akkermansiaceae bacterium]MDB4464855.1 class I SAM-dependent methyltransferase [Akkermansiaceae bacterium]MDB4466336.1 class I SAM-dependent methyltransferase [bacterium]